jgi:hypothetical protein
LCGRKSLSSAASFPLTRTERALAETTADLIGVKVAESIVLPTLELAPQPAPVEGLAVNVQQLVNLRNGTGTSPSVYTVAGGSALWPLSVICRLTTSAVVANRSVSLEYRTPDGTRYLVAGTQVVQTASDTWTYCWHPEAGNVAWPVPDAILAPLPQQHLMPSFQLAVVVGNGDAGDVLDQVLLSARFDPLAERDI